jgi:hypothetical protein
MVQFPSFTNRGELQTGVDALRAPGSHGHPAFHDIDDLGLDGREEAGDLIREHAERAGVLRSGGRESGNDDKER